MQNKGEGHKDLWNERVSVILFILILVAGVALRLFQYLMGRSIWEDEAHLALNFMDRDLLQLMRPLDHLQAAPVLFIIIIKCIIVIFGASELAFRALPLIASLVSLSLFYKIVKELSGNRNLALLCFFIFSINISAVYFSSELKPYAIDLAVYLIMVYFFLDPDKFLRRRRNPVLALAGAAAILLSNVAVIVLFCISLLMIGEVKREKTSKRGAMSVLFSWLIVFAINYFLFIYKHPYWAKQKENYAFAFIPHKFFGPDFSRFILKTWDETFFSQLLAFGKGYGFEYILIIILLLSLAHLIIRKEQKILALLFLPVFLHLFLSFLHLYPFWYRLILYLLPCLIYLVAHGAWLIADFLNKTLHRSAAIVFLVICSVYYSVGSIKKFPLWEREIKPAIDFVNAASASNAHLYITDPVNAYRYYFKRGYAAKEIYKEIPWELDTMEYYDLVAEETQNYFLFYGTTNLWGYADILHDLKKKNLVVKNFSFKGYAVIEVRALPRDTSVFSKRIDHRYFEPEFIFGGDRSIALWKEQIDSRRFYLRKGKYKFTLVCRGTPFAGIYPRTEVLVNKIPLGEFTAGTEYESLSFSYQQERDSLVNITLKLINDTATRKEDRNTFIRSIVITKE